MTTSVVDGIWDTIPPNWRPPTPAQWSNVLPPTPQLYERLWRRRSLTLLSGRKFPVSDELDEMHCALGALDATSIGIDIGCSEGLYARSLLDRGCGVVVGIDHSRPFLTRLRNRLLRDPRSQKVVAIRALAQNLPLRSACIDVAVMGGSLNEIGDQEGAFIEMGRVCKAGATMFNMSLVSAGSRWGQQLQKGLGRAGVVFPSLAQTKEWSESAGFETLSVETDRVVARIGGRRQDSDQSA